MDESVDEGASEGVDESEGEGASEGEGVRVRVWMRVRVQIRVRVRARGSTVGRLQCRYLTVVGSTVGVPDILIFRHFDISMFLFSIFFLSTLFTFDVFSFRHF